MSADATPKMARPGWLLIGIAACAVLILVSVPVAAAKVSPRVHLSLIPLPKSALGPPARKLKLSYDSGASAAFTRGRIGGYALHYGNEASGLPGVDSVWTSIDEYADAKSAGQGLRSSKAEDAQVTGLNGASLSVTYRRVKVAAIGSASFGDLTSYSASNISPVSIFAEWFTDGRYLLEVRVAARTAARAMAAAPGYVAKLDARLQLALDGRLRARALKLVRRPKPGPPPGGPDLSAMGLATTDLSGAATLVGDSYLAKPSAAEPDPLARSTYFVGILPAGPFDTLSQHIEWFPTANEAAFDADRWLAGETAPTAHPLDLPGVGDNARCIYLAFNPGFVALVTFSTGHLTEILQIDSHLDAPLSDVSTVAQTAADKISAQYTG
jgi:hypothetical protein